MKLLEQKYTISGLYYNYGKTTDDVLRKYLSSIKIVVSRNEGNLQFYYPLSDDSVKKMLEQLRSLPITNVIGNVVYKPVTGLKEYKIIKYLVKSTSRFFVKPDIGEIIDQINFHDLLTDKIKAIEILSHVCEVLPDTDGEHFILEAKLLVDSEYNGR